MTGIVFVPLLAFTIIFSFALWCYASFIFVSVTEETAAGNDLVVWDDGGFLDCFQQGVYLAWVVGVWMVPASLVASIATARLEDGKPYAFALIAFLVFWLTFPLSLLSSMAAESRMALLHAGLFQRLGRRTPDVFIFYLLSGLIVAACVPLAPWLITGPSPFVYFIAGPLLALAVLLYARLMGRLACLARLTSIRRKKKKRKAKQKSKTGAEVSDPWEVPEEVQREEAARGTGFVQPSDLPPVDSPYEGEIVGYDVNFADVPKEPEPQPVMQGAPKEEWAGTEVERAAAQAERQDVSAIEPDELEMERARRRKEKAPEHPWADSRIWLFPLQPKTVVHGVILAGGIGFFGALFQTLIALWPF